jgi:hypothetical protein
MTDTTTDSQPPRRTISRELQVVEGGAEPSGPRKKKSSWSQASFVAGLLGAVFGLVGSLVGVGVVWGGSQAQTAVVSEKVKTLEAAVDGKADKAEAAKREERLREQELASAALKAANTAEHVAINTSLSEVKKDTADTKTKVEEIDKKLDRVLAKMK